MPPATTTARGGPPARSARTAIETRLPVTLELDRADRPRESDALGERLLHRIAGPVRLTPGQYLLGVGVQASPDAASAGDRSHDDVEVVVVGHELAARLGDLAVADGDAVLLGDHASLEVPIRTPVGVHMPELVERPAVLWVCLVRKAYERGEIVIAERAQRGHAVTTCSSSCSPSSMTFTVPKS